MGQLEKALNRILEPEQIITGEELSHRYPHVWQTDQPLSALALVLPKNTNEVSKVLQLCHQHEQPLVVQGGLTNLVASTQSGATDLVISLEKMNSILEIDPQARTLTVEAGVILEAVQNAAREHNLWFPLNFGAKGSAQMGGIIATNAGGLRVFRYGMTRNLVLGLETVLADGTILSSLKKIIKDNSGYDLKQLFIGSEGTLGIVTKAVFRLHEAPKSRISAFIGLNDYGKVVEFLKFMEQGLSGMLSGYELIWQSTLKALTGRHSTMTSPISTEFDYYVLLEGLGSDQSRDQALWENLLDHALSHGLILDAVPAYAPSELEKFWAIRENVEVLVAQCRVPQSFDISLPIAMIGDITNGMVEKLRNLDEVDKVFAFGHVADGNIHLMVDKANDLPILRQRINEIVYEPLLEIGGSISAEHGIGLEKKPYLENCRTEPEIRIMSLLKQTLDPHGILNPGKIIPDNFNPHQFT